MMLNKKQLKRAARQGIKHKLKSKGLISQTALYREINKDLQLNVFRQARSEYVFVLKKAKSLSFNLSNSYLELKRQKYKLAFNAYWGLTKK